MENDGLSAKRRDKKILITDIAIEKIPRIKYVGFTESENDILYRMARLVLLTSKDENNSNEVAVTCAFDDNDPLEHIGISLGNEHEVDVCADTLSNHLILSAKKCVVVVLHNHPTTQTLSIEDIRFFLHYASIKMIVVVTNQGTIHYLCKDEKYSYDAAVELYKECVADLNRNSKAQEYYVSGLRYLLRCSEAGLFYH